MTQAAHLPVMLQEVLDALSPRDGGRYLDGTFGRGGYSRALLAAADTRVLGIDRDPQAVAAGEALAAETADRFQMRAGRFGEMDRLAAAAGFLPLPIVRLALPRIVRPLVRVCCPRAGRPLVWRIPL